ncbi:MAG TPA: DUF2589 domain-containing protein, partial [Miltoncostaeaceae bacterium]|nr:DUF2589 domain-containing protein [Miltoncostaeaceae bacterium]
MADQVIQRSTDLAALLGGLMASVVQADAIAAQTTLEFINDVGFVPVDPARPDDEQRLRTASFRYTKRDANGAPSEFVAVMPLLSLLAIPALQVRRAVLNLEIKVDEVVTPPGNAPDPAAPAPAGPPDNPGGTVRIAQLKRPDLVKIIGRVGVKPAPVPSPTTPA